MKHRIRQYGDEYHCSCGLVWDAKEDDPHDGKEDGRAELKKIKEMLKSRIEKDEPTPTSTTL